MENDFIFTLKDFSFEVIIIALCVFGLTMLVKWPIKKYTSKFEENKRKAINTVIIFIPMILSFFICTLYSGIFKHDWFSISILHNSTNAYILSVSLYAIVSRIINMIKAGSVKTAELGKEAVKYIKKNIKIISKTVKVDESKLQELVKEIERLLALKTKLSENTVSQDIATAEKFDTQIEDLESQKKSIEASLKEQKQLLNAYENSLKTNSKQ